jgi:cellobiose phosphorylase
VGRGGWTWYTGSAGWLYRLGLEAILGVRRRGDALEVAPCVPASWPGYEVEVRAGRARYRIVVENPDRVAGGGVRATLDGAPLPGAAIPLCDDGASHEARVRIVADGAR